jgi:hypothetical protein
MTPTLPLILVLALLAWLVVRSLRLPAWAWVVLILFGFYLAHTYLAPLIDSGTRTATTIVNHPGH